MKAILLPVLAGIAIFFGIPMLNENSINPCGAYNEMAVRTGAPTLGGQTPAPDPFGGKGIAGVAEALDLLQGCVEMACTNEHQDHEGNRTPENEHPHVR